MSGDYAIAQNLLLGHSKVCGLMDYKAVDFDECAGVDKSFDSFSRGHLSPRVLRLNLLGSAAELSLLAFFFSSSTPLVQLIVSNASRLDPLIKSRHGLVC